MNPNSLPTTAIECIILLVLSEKEKNRYQRQLILPDWGETAQEKLKSSKVLVVGAGGLGTPVLAYLAAGGVGKLGIVEFDRVDESNLHRQIFYRHSDTGSLKSTLAAERIQEINPELAVEIFPDYLTAATAQDIFTYYDVVVDGSDNLPTRYLVNDACLLTGKPLVHGSVYRMEGQVSVFNVLLSDGTRSADYRDLFPEPPPPDLVPSCSDGGVLGTLPGIIGSMMANETLKLITDVGQTLHNKLLVFDGAEGTARTIGFSKRPDREPIKALIDYEAFCDRRNQTNTVLQEMVPVEAHDLLKKNKAVVIDVREPHEYALANIGGRNIPLKEIEQLLYHIPRQTPVIMVCKTGSRSAKAVSRLQGFGFRNLSNLRGGLNRWRAEVDPSLPPC